MPDRVVTYSFRGNFANLGAGLTAMGRNVDATAAKLTALDKNGAKMRVGLTQVGDTAGRVGLLFAAGVGAAVGVAANFDKAMSSVQAATHETAENMDALREAAIEAGAETAYSASEAAGAIEELAKAGVSTKDILGGGLAGSLDLAAAGAIEVADAAEIAATAMTQFQLGGDQVTHIADLLAAGAGKAQGSVDDLGMALKQSGLVASQTGLSIEEATGTLAAFASAGLIGSDAGTSFKTMLQSLTPSSTKAKELMDELGISAYDAQGNFVGMTEFAGQLQGALAGLSVEQQNAALKTIFGSDAVRAASVIFEQGADGVQSWIDKTNDSGYAAETAATRLDNLTGDLEQFKGSLETALIGTGEGAQGPLRDLTQSATKAVNAFNDLPGPVKNTTLALGALAALTGGALWFGSKVITGVANTKQALSDLGIEAGRARGALVRVAATAAGLYAVGAAVRAIGEDLGSNINTADLSRDLEAIARGETTDSLNELAGALEGVNEAGAGTISALFSIPGGLLGMDTSFQKSQSVVDAFDQKLAELVEGGNAEQAAALFERIRDAAAQRGGVSDADVVKSFDSYAKALDNVAGAAEDADDATGDLAGATGKAGVAATKAARQQEQQAAAMREQQKAARDTARGFITLGDSLDDSKKSLGDWLRELEKQAAALRDFTQNAKTAAKRGLDEGLIKSLNEAGPAGALRMKQLANATDAEIKRANKAWRDGQRAISEYVNMRVPAKDVRVNNQQALDAIAVVQARLASLRSKTIAIDIATGQRRAGGGPIYGPGTKTSDSVPVMASRGEFMMSAAAVDHYGLDTMFKMNARRLATGGDVMGRTSGLSPSSQLFGIDQAFLSVRELAERLSNLGANQIKGLARDFDKLGKFELTKLGKALDLATKAIERQAERSREFADEQKEQLKALRDARRQFAQEVTRNFRSDIFGGVDLEQAARDGLLGGDFMSNLMAWLRENNVDMSAGGMISDYAGQYLQTLTPAQIAALQAQATVGQLGLDSQNAGAFEQVLQQLRAMGLTGGAYTELASSGNLALAQQYAAMGPDFVKTLMQEFRDRNSELRNLGQSVGNAQFGADIREQRKAMERAVRVAERQEAELKEANRINRLLERRLAAIEEHGPRKTGQATAKALDDASASTQRRP